jgi:hypothetical protein
VPEQLQKITAAPWKWQCIGMETLYLATPDRGKLIVMDAMPRRAAVRFARRTDDMGGILVPATIANIYEFPDARAIEAAPELVAMVRRLYDRLCINELVGVYARQGDWVNPEDEKAANDAVALLRRIEGA